MRSCTKRTEFAQRLPVAYCCAEQTLSLHPEGCALSRCYQEPSHKPTLQRLREACRKNHCVMASRTAEYVPKTKKKAPKANKAKQPSTSALFHAKPFCLRRIWMTHSGGTT